MPRGAIHVAVVDPDVGTDRAALGVETETGTLIAPDNGLVTGLLNGFRRAHRLENEALARLPRSNTFHGRDVFAPAAGHLARGVDLAEFGPPVPPDDIVRLDGFFAHERENEAVGRVMAVDRFGNLRTNVRAEWLTRGRLVLGSGPGALEISARAETYRAAPPGSLFAYAGSAGTIEVAVFGGSASAVTGSAAGAEVRVEAT
jgi:S-adenosylmethionine hydrolase